MTRAAALLAAVLLAAGCSLLDGDDEEPRAARYLVYTKQVGLRGEAIWIGNVDGRGMRRLSAGYGGLVSPDGRWVAFHRCIGAFEDCQLGEGRTHIRVIGADGTSDRMLVDGGSAEEWFPDSRHLLARSGGALVRVDIETEKETILARPPRQLLGWSISPAGDELVYAVLGRGVPTHICPFKGDLFVAQADGGGTRRLTAGGRDSDPSWVRDSLLFAREPRGCRLPASGIWTMRPDGTELRPIVRVAPRTFASNGYYGLRPFGRVAGRPLLVAGVRTEWGNELALVDTRTGRVWRPDVDPRPRIRDPMYVQYVSRDGRHTLGTACGAEFPCSIDVYSVLERRGRVLASGRVAGAHWNR